MGMARNANRDIEVRAGLFQRKDHSLVLKRAVPRRAQSGIRARQLIHIIGVLFVRRRRVCGVPGELVLDSGLAAAAPSSGGNFRVRKTVRSGPIGKRWATS